ncbi:MAG: CAP domain-containing protein [Bacteroidales bacterium]
MKKIVVLLILILFSLCCRKDKDRPVFFPALKEQVNEHRTGLGLPAFSVNPSLRDLARKHSYNMASGKIHFGHGGFQSQANLILKKPGNGNVGENIAMSSDDAEYTVDSLWLLSPGHKSNIEGIWSFTGIGVCTGNDGYCYYTRLFYKPQ